MNRFDWLKVVLEAIVYVIFPALAKSRGIPIPWTQLELDLHSVSVPEAPTAPYKGPRLRYVLAQERVEPTLGNKDKPTKKRK